MENTNNWFKIIIAVAVLIVAVSVGYYFIASSKQQGQTSGVDSQARCAEEAKSELYYQQNNPVANNMNYTNFSELDHYNQKLDKCFVLVTFHEVNGTQINVNNILTEVNLNDTPRGNKVVADCVQLIDLSKTAICFIDDSKYVAKDVSYKEFQDFVNQKLEQN